MSLTSCVLKRVTLLIAAVSSSDAGFEPPISTEDDWSDVEEIPGSIVIPSRPRAPDRYARRAYSL